MDSDFAVIFSFSFEFELSLTRVATRRNSGDWQAVTPIRQGKSITECAICPQADRVSADGNPRVRLRSSVYDQFRINIEPKTELLFQLAPLWARNLLAQFCGD